MTLPQSPLSPASPPASHFQRSYYRQRLCGASDLDALARAMSQAGYTPAAAWFARWDETAERRGLRLEREMGLVCGGAARPEFFNEAMRQLMRELERAAARPPVAAVPAPGPALAAAG